MKKIRQRYYGILLRETKRLSDLIDDMLELSRLQTSAKVANLGPIYLQRDLLDLAMRFEVLASQKNITFEINQPAQPLPSVWGKVDRITQILSTSWRMRSSSRLKVEKIEMIINEDKSGLSVSIRDNGEGIKAKRFTTCF